MLPLRCPRSIEGGISAPTCHNLPANALVLCHQLQISEEFTEALAKESLGVSGVASALGIYPNLCHHRVPPNSPILHNSPSEYLFSQSFSFSDCKRVSRLPSASRSHIRTLS